MNGRGEHLDREPDTSPHVLAIPEASGTAVLILDERPLSEAWRRRRGTLGRRGSRKVFHFSPARLPETAHPTPPQWPEERSTGSAGILAGLRAQAPQAGKDAGVPCARETDETNR
jgi:hypothetical protein